MSARLRSCAMSARTFVVTVTQSSDRVLVEDVRNRRRIVATNLDALGEQIAQLIRTPPDTE